MTLVSILGDFHSSILPITYEFKEKITKHLIVYDDSKHDVNQSRRMIRGQSSYLDTLPLNCNKRYELISYKIDEDRYESIEKCYQYLLELTNDPDEIYLNATDGLSTVGIVLSSKLLAKGASVISYDRYANTYNLHTLNSMKKHNINDNMDVQTHLLMKGYKLLEKADRKDLESRKDHIYALTDDLKRFKAFADQMYGKKLDQINDYTDYKIILNEIGRTDQKFIQGTVFEEYIYHLLVDNFSSNFDDIQMGFKVEFDAGVENEFDILMIKDNHLHTIECKLVKNLDGEHHVYKTELIMDYLDDDGRAMILSIGSGNENRNKQKFGKVKFSNGTKARASYGDIKIHQSKKFDEEAFLNDIREWFFS